MNLTLYVADRKVNALMKAFDMCPDYKVFVSILEEDVERKGADSDKAFIKRIIEGSQKYPDFWIPAAVYNGVFYAAEGIKILSDGQKEMFLPAGAL